MIPEVNKIYNCFDDGKISKSRLYTVEITELIPFEDIDKQTLLIWEEATERHKRLYSQKTDYFVKYTNGENGEDGVFVRTKCGGWFGLGDLWNSGRLDIDGSLTKIIKG